MIKHLQSLLSVTLLSIIIVAFSVNSGYSQQEYRDNTPGNVSFTVKTVTANGNYAPRHVFAIWVEYEGDFVKTRKAMANQRKQYLYTWRAASNYNVVDAITGATLNSHTTHNISWDCTDLDGNIVPDGQYVMWVEFTEKHGQGPVFSIEFEKGTSLVTITPANQTNFINMELTYEPEQIATADFTADLTEVCAMETVEFTDNSTGATSWAWNFGEGAMPATANTQGPHDVYYNNTGSKTVELIVNGSITQTKADYITVYANPEATFTFEVLSKVANFTNNSTGAVSYLWDFGDEQTSTEENPSHFYEEDGNYEVVLTATSEMCGDDTHTETVVIYTVGVADIKREAFSIYPNPNSGNFTITSEANIAEAQMTLFDIRGRQIFCNFLDMSGKENHISRDVIDLKPGLYFITITNDKVNFHQKLIVN